jgi:hypothetical protein
MRNQKEIRSGCASSVVCILVLSVFIGILVTVPKASAVTEFGPLHGDAGNDIDGDLRYEWLCVLVSVSIDTAGDYYVHGNLRDSIGFTIEDGVVYTYLDVGDHWIEFRYLGSNILFNGMDGPYNISLMLYDDFFNQLDSDYHITTPYLVTQFDDDLPPEYIINSTFTSNAPVIDGSYSPSEWSDAAFVDLGTINGNEIDSLLLIKNDNINVYIAYDANGDTTSDLSDGAAIAFDTDNNNAPTDTADDQFVLGGFGNPGHYNYTTSGDFWKWEDDYNASLPNHATLAGARGFGASDFAPVPHRIYEWSIPLALIDVPSPVPADYVLGFAGLSQIAPGVFNGPMSEHSTWPKYVGGPPELSLYGDLVLATGSQPQQPPTDGGNITGTVVDSNDEPLEGALVSLINKTTGDTADTDETNSNGEYNFNYEKAGNYELRIAKDGYLDESDSATISTGLTTDAGTVALAENGRISGSAKDLDGLKIPGATVELFQNGIKIKTANTNSTGEFEFLNLTYGNYSVKVSKSGYEGGEQTLDLKNGADMTPELHMSMKKLSGLGDYWWAFLIVALVVIIVLVIFLLMRKRSKGMPESHEQPPQLLAYQKPPESNTSQVTGVCKNCGQALESEYILCPNCGTKV